MIGRSGERWSGISVLAARHDDDERSNHFKKLSYFDNLLIEVFSKVHAILPFFFISSYNKLQFRWVLFNGSAQNCEIKKIFLIFCKNKKETPKRNSTKIGMLKNKI